MSAKWKRSFKTLLQPALDILVRERLGEFAAVKEGEGVEHRAHHACPDAVIALAAEQVDDQHRSGQKRTEEHHADAAGRNVVDDARPGSDTIGAGRPHIALAAAAKPDRHAALGAEVLFLAKVVGSRSLCGHGGLRMAMAALYATIGQAIAAVKFLLAPRLCLGAQCT